MKKEIESLKEKIKGLEQKHKEEEDKEESPKRKRIKRKCDAYLDKRVNNKEDTTTTTWEESDATIHPSEEIPGKNLSEEAEFRCPEEPRRPARTKFRCPEEADARRPRGTRTPKTDDQRLKQKREALIKEMQENRKRIKERGTMAEVQQGRSREGYSGEGELLWPPLPQRTSRKDIKVVSNIQVVPPRGERNKEQVGNNQEEWKTVRNRKDIKKDSKAKKIQEQERRERTTAPKTRRRFPRSAAITIRGVKENFSYAEALRRARDDPMIKEIGVENTRLRKTAMGNILIEVTGEREEG